MRAATTLALLGLLALVGTTVATPAPQEFNAIDDFGADENGADNDMDTDMADLAKRDLQRTTVKSSLFDAPFILDVKNQKTHLQRSKGKPVPRRRKGRGNKYASRRPGVGGRFGQRYRASGPKRGRGMKGHHKRDFQRTKESSSTIAAPFILDIKKQKTHLERPSRPMGGAHGSAKPDYGRYKRGIQSTKVKESSSMIAAPFILDLKKQKTHLERPSRPMGGAHGSAKPGYGRYKRGIQSTKVKESSSMIAAPFILDIKKQKTHLERPSRPMGGAHGSAKPGYGRYKRGIQSTKVKESSSMFSVPFILDIKKQKTHLERPSRPMGGAHGSAKPGYGHAGHAKY